MAEESEWIGWQYRGFAYQINLGREEVKKRAGGRFIPCEGPEQERILKKYLTIREDTQSARSLDEKVQSGIHPKYGAGKKC